MYYFQAKRITPEELNKLKELLEKIKQEKNRRKLIQLDAEFHDLVNYSTKNQALAKNLKRLRNQIGRLWFFTKAHDAYSQKIPEDFKELIKALENKEQNKSEQIMKDHCIHTVFILSNR